MIDYKPLHPIIKNYLDKIYTELDKLSDKFTFTNVCEIRSAISEKKFLEMYSYFQDCNWNDIIIGYHATKEEYKNSIILNGFNAPYQETYSRRTGQRYGKGVYVSDNMNFAMNYYGGILFICIASLGESKKLTSSEGGKYSNKELDCDSFNISPEIILRGSIQVLPLLCLNVQRKMDKEKLYKNEIKLINGINPTINSLCLTHFKKYYNNPIIHELLSIEYENNKNENDIIKNVNELIEELDFI